ncbi:MAG: ATP-binding protein [Spongiibacteraceae bacterium]|nr:ATP-binding protein [Spongiibacteraceae bacterium]
MRRQPRSLTYRLLLASLVTLPIYLAATGWFLHRSFTASQMAAAQERLRVQFYGLLDTFEFDAGALHVGRASDPRLNQLNSGLYAYVHDQDGELLWQSFSSYSLPLTTAAVLGEEPAGTGEELFEQQSGKPPLLRFQYGLLWETTGGDLPLVVTLVESAAALAAEGRAFRGQLWFLLGGAALLLTLAQALILHWGLRPLRRLADDVTELEQGQRAMLSRSYPAELQPLASNLNQLLERERRQRERYRHTLADLAHSLKTPLAVLQQGTAGDVVDNALLREQVSRMDQLINYQLQRAVASHSRQLGTATPLRPVVDKLIATFGKVYYDKRIQMTVEVAPALRCRADEADLFELLGNLLDNACKACDHRVAVGATLTDSWLLLIIDDDGPGIDEQQRDRLLGRGERADSYEPGQGIGLAVVMDIIDSYGAELDIGLSRWHGARFTVRWPGLT